MVFASAQSSKNIKLPEMKLLVFIVCSQSKPKIAYMDDPLIQTTVRM